MSGNKKPAIFISSTCYDLSQIRLNIKNFIESLGFEPLLSELPTFPVIPNNNTIENCLQAVRNCADIFVLIIGGRYGTFTEQGRSITNLEYKVAKSLEIPIYVFISRDVLNYAKVWEKNPEGDFSDVVDSNKIFAFIKDIQSSNHWISPFGSATDIIVSLREHISHLFAEMLRLRKKVIVTHLPKNAENLSAKALKLLLDKDRCWEFLLFSQVLEDAIGAVAYSKLDMEHKVIVGELKLISDPLELSSFLQTKMKKAMSTVQWTANLINNQIRNAFGEPGCPGNEEMIIYIAQRIGEAYRQSIEWSLEFNSLDAPADFEEVIRASSTLCQEILREIEDIPDRLRQTLKEALQKPGQPMHIAINFTVPDIKSVIDAMRALVEKYTQD